METAESFISKLNLSFTESFPNGFISTQIHRSLCKADAFKIYVVFTILPLGAQTNGIVENDPSLNKFFIYIGENLESLPESIQTDLFQGNRLYSPKGPQAGSEKLGWRNGKASAEKILKKFDLFFKKVRAMVDANGGIEAYQKSA